jgi:hypothetical protein
VIHLASARIGERRVSTFLQDGQIRTIDQNGDDDFLSMEEATALAALLTTSIEQAYLKGVRAQVKP